MGLIVTLPHTVWSKQEILININLWPRQLALEAGYMVFLFSESPWNQRKGTYTSVSQPTKENSSYSSLSIRDRKRNAKGLD